ncbi:MAG: lysophospholipid acyltransferase family protein [Bacteroidetes bacterium]|nr:lysophospholipid acyltransferase family protein [Bacteroidota bacterium]HET6243653.1 lysophospholipid acyltransferase family protein [Bacteroidia bacterium]
MRKLFNWIFRKHGWKIQGGLPLGTKKCVLLAAPHTSNWDFVYGIGALEEFNLDVKYLAKKELFRFPFKGMFESLGGVPVDRSKSNSMVDAMIELINSKDEIIVMIPPEGTRSRVDKWKSGFYHVALGAQVPIVLGYLDYKNKVAGIGPALMPSGDKEKDYKVICDFYKKTTAKWPENFNCENVF